ncbi:MAG: hypothetical protein FJ272_04910, partial [Planctomycetes bacterium]|nr:hypothetical protein [Planctomycetota bacterium]
MTLSNLFKVLFTVGLLALIVALFGPGKMARAFEGADYALTALAFLLTPVVIFLKAFRWHVLARSKLPGIPFLTSLKSYLAGLALAVVTPL